MTTEKEKEKSRTLERGDGGYQRPTNEYVLNVAFVSFLAFTLVQTIFALRAKSEAMLADSEAMFVDALTYLFNLWAERLKNSPYTAEELSLSHEVRHRRRKLKRLYLELIPPTISVTTLVVVTILALKEAFGTLLGSADGGDGGDDGAPDLSVMLFFSGLNLLLDILNVTCFAKADQAVGLPISYENMQLLHHGVTQAEKTSLRHGEARKLSTNAAAPSYQAINEEAEEDHDEEDKSMLTDTYHTSCEHRSEGDSLSTDGDFMGVISLNLNMCSAWTHICADTLRSTAVLLAAGVAVVIREVSAESADAIAAIVVSFIITCSLAPLIQGLFLTASEILTMKREDRFHASSQLGLTISV